MLVAILLKACFYDVSINEQISGFRKLFEKQSAIHEIQTLSKSSLNYYIYLWIVESFLNKI